MVDRFPGDSPPVPLWECLKGGRVELEKRFDAHSVPRNGRTLIVEALEGDPVKRVVASRCKPAFRIASRKFGVTLQASSSVEASYVHRCEHSDDVQLLACRPFSVKVPKVDSRGRLRRDRYTPHYLVLENDGFVAVECKTREALEEDAQKPNPMYAREGAEWVAPAAREVFARLGIEHRIVTREDVNHVWLRNVRYLSGHVGAPPPDGVECAERAVREARSSQLVDLRELDGVTGPALLWLVANRRLYCDLDRERLFDCDEVWLHESEEVAIAHGYLTDTAGSDDAPDAPGWPFHHDVRPVVLDPGEEVYFSDVHCTVVNRSADGVTVRSTLEVEGEHRVFSLALDHVHKLLRTGELRAARSIGEEAMSRARYEIFLSATPVQLEQANRWWRGLVHYAEHKRLPHGVSLRTIRDHQKWVREGKAIYGRGFLGLIRPRGRSVGTVMVPAAQRKLIAEATDEFRGKGDPVDAPPARRESSAHGLFAAKCDEAGIDLEDVVSERTFRRHVRVGSAASAEARRRGARAGYQLAAPRLHRGASLPRHGDRAWELAHADHTQLDLKFVSARTGAVLGRPWLSILVDAYTRCVLSFRLSFDPPSREAVFGLLYECAFRRLRLPELIVVDQGSDFLSNDFDRALAYLGVSKLERPAGHARYGSPVERLFGTSNTVVVHEQPGSTEPVQLGRMLSSSHQPERRAAWTLRAFQPVAARWFYDVYPTRIHSSHGVPPGVMWERSLARCGEHVARYIACDDALRAVLSQTVDAGGTRVVNVGGTVFVKHLTFAHPALEDKRLIGEELSVKLCLADASRVWVHVPHLGGPVPAHVCDGDADLAGLSWRAVNCALEELRAQRRVGRSTAARKHNAALVGAALADTRAESADLLLRRLERDAEQAGTAPEPPSDVASDDLDAQSPPDDDDGDNDRRHRLRQHQGVLTHEKAILRH